MKTAKKGLQKFTETEKKLSELLALKQITQNDLNNLTSSEREQFGLVATNKLTQLKGIERDKFLHQIDLITTQSIKNQLWESNHKLITSAIATLIQEYGCMPTKNQLAEKTGLSRQTIHKHIKEYSTHPQYLAELEQFRFMNSKVLATVFNFAINGDMKAAKLYFEIISRGNNQQANATLIQQQNNYIQINGTVISQESIKQLNPEQLGQIESVIKGSLPKPVEII